MTSLEARPMSNQYHTTATAAALHNPHLTRLDFHTEKKSFATQPNTSKIESFRNYKHLANETCSNNTAGIRFHFAPRCTAELPYPESIILPDNPFSEKIFFRTANSDTRYPSQTAHSAAYISPLLKKNPDGSAKTHNNPHPPKNSE